MQHVPGDAPDANSPPDPPPPDPPPLGSPPPGAPPAGAAPTEASVVPPAGAPPAGAAPAGASVVPRSRRRRVMVGAAALALVVAGGAAFLLLRGGGNADDDVDAAIAGIADPAGGVADMPMAVAGAVVLRDTLVLTVRAAGQAAALRSAVLRAQVAGQVVAVPVRENARVAQGALLVALDPEEYALALDEARARLAQVAAQYREATLFDQRIDNEAQRQERAAAARARTGLEAAEIAVRRAELSVRRTRLTAPFAGVAANVNVMPGYAVAAGDELLTIQDTDPLRVEVQVLESEIGTLRAGGTATVTFAAFPGTPFAGRIETINPVVEQQSRTARVTIAVANPGGRVLPGMYATVTLGGTRLADRTFVPLAAILERDRRSLVIVFSRGGADGAGGEGGGARGAGGPVGPGGAGEPGGVAGAGEAGEIGVAEPRFVRTGVRTATHVEILPDPETGAYPLRPGDVVLTEGHGSLQAGTSIRLERVLGGISSAGTIGPDGGPP